MSHNKELQTKANESGIIQWEQVPGTGVNIKHRSENNFCKQYSAVCLLAYPDGTPRLREVVCLRLYRTNARCYACVWISGLDGNPCGSAVNQGYGMDLAPGAVMEAFSAAGFEIYSPGGVQYDPETILESFINKYFPGLQFLIVRANP